MSLLIKALDHLDKSKQAEKSKKLTGEYVADEALMLELLPVDTEQTVVAKQLVAEQQAVAEPQAVAEQSIEEKLAFADAVETAVAENVAIARVLTLEEEAGLTGTHFAIGKYAKPKQSGVKVTAEKSATQTTILTNLPNDAPQLAVTKNATKNTTADQAKDQASPTTAFQTVDAGLNQKAAAKVFVANKAVKAPSSKYALLTLGVAGALLVWLGLQGYSYIKTLSAPEVVVLKPAAMPPSTPIQPQVVVAAPAEVATILPAENPSAANQADANPPNNTTSASAFKQKAAAEPSVLDDAIEDTKQAALKKPRAKKVINNNVEAYASEDDANSAAPTSSRKSKSVTLISKAPSLGVDPTLLAAYQAFTRGENAVAQQQYRQVLQHDVHNVDALLGMAAIAQRQGRDADAAGWYQKVLEIEPRNTIALSGMTGAGQQANDDPIAAESRIKNMLTQQPEAAHLQAALGNLYAEQSQWPSAQEAYFNASRLAPNNADYAFNLAVSLDQMGKSNLALKQYQRTLELLNKSGAASPDRATLEARINVLQ